MMTTELRLFGPPSLQINSRPVRLHSAKVLALLAFLALEPEKPHSREKLANLFWSEKPDPKARQSLRQALYSLRQTLKEDCLAVSKVAVVFQPQPDIWIDGLEFSKLAATTPNNLSCLRHAADLYRGPLLEGVALSNCPVFEEWLFFQRDVFEQKALGIFQNLADGLIQQRSYQEALTFARQLVALDMLHEGAYRQLMRVHAALGDVEGVHRQYRLCTKVLAREMGVEPAPETRALYQQLTTA